MDKQQLAELYKRRARNIMEVFDVKFDLRKTTTLKEKT